MSGVLTLTSLSRSCRAYVSSLWDSAKASMYCCLSFITFICVFLIFTFAVSVVFMSVIVCLSSVTDDCNSVIVSACFRMVSSSSCCRLFSAWA